MWVRYKTESDMDYFPIFAQDWKTLAQWASIFRCPILNTSSWLLFSLTLTEVVDTQHFRKSGPKHMKWAPKNGDFPKMTLLKAWSLAPDRTIEP